MDPEIAEAIHQLWKEYIAAWKEIDGGRIKIHGALERLDQTGASRDDFLIALRELSSDVEIHRNRFRDVMGQFGARVMDAVGDFDAP